MRGDLLQGMALHTMTTKQWSIDACIENYARRGLGGISIWRETVAGKSLPRVRKALIDSGLKGVSYVRGGFFTGRTADERAAGLEENVKTLAECEALSLPMLVLVCGATPPQTPDENFEQILEGIGKLLPRAKEAGIKLAIEPLHPVYAGNRSAIACLDDAMALCDVLADSAVGIALDVYHIWWERRLQQKIQRIAEAGRLFAYHVCDFKPDMEDLLQDRGIMGEGCIALREIDRSVGRTTFFKEGGLREVEIFSKKWWGRDPVTFLDAIEEAYAETYSKNT